jgi:hypothetical protein
MVQFAQWAVQFAQWVVQTAPYLNTLFNIQNMLREIVNTHEI